MRRLILILALLACTIAVGAGCGGGDDDSSGDPLESALAYVPSGTPFAVAIDTDVEGDQYKALEKILGRFPGGGGIAQSLRNQLEAGAEGISYDKDIKPLLGNPFVVSATDPASFLSSSNSDFVAAIQVKDTDALDRIIEKTKPDERGEAGGGKVYVDNGTAFGVDGDMLVFAASQKLVESALERADGGDHLDLDSFDRSLEGLPEQALARIYVDVQGLLEQDPSASATRQVKWIGALRTLGMTAVAGDDSVDVQFNMRTEGDLSEEDLPLAAGDEAPGVVRVPGEVAFSLRDPSQTLAFFESTFQTLDPQSFGDYETGKKAIQQRFGIDVDKDLFGQLTGDLAVSVAVDGAFGARAEVADPAAFGKTVDRLADALPQLGAGLGVTGVSRRGDLYEARLANGGRFAFGMADGAFVAGSDVKRALAAGSAQPEDVPDAKGSLVTAASAQELAIQILDRFAPDLGLGGSLFAGPLKDLSGSVVTTTDGMRGSFSLTLD
jgi:uncharacterized protein DUF3352